MFALCAPIQLARSSITLAARLCCPASVPMHPTPAIIAPALSPSASEPEPSLDRCIGELVAAAAGAIAQGLHDFAHRGLTIRTKARGGDLIADLYRLRQFMIADWDFDALARREGAAVLREHCGDDISDATIAELVGAVLEILAKVVRAALN
jgi:hypothetical protein